MTHTPVYFLGGPLDGESREWFGGLKIIVGREACEGCGGEHTYHLYEVISEKPDVVAQWKGVVR